VKKDVKSKVVAKKWLDGRLMANLIATIQVNLVIVKKDVKSKVAAKKWLDGRLMAKNLIATIQVNLVTHINGLLGSRTLLGCFGLDKY